MNIPLWLTDTEAVAPCPCGHLPDNNVIVVVGEGEDGLRRWFHEPCMDFLGYELGEEAYPHMDEWRKHRHENSEDS